MFLHVQGLMLTFVLGEGLLDQLKSTFNIGDNLSKITIFVAIDVEKSLTTFRWTGDSL